MMKRRILLGVAAMLLVGGTASAQTFFRTFVSTFGSDASLNCSRVAPCRNIQVAVNVTSARGEVVILDSGGYGAFGVSSGISVISPPGVHAAIAPTSGTAVSASSGSDVVLIRGLYLNSQGAETGIVANGSVLVENVVVSGFLVGIQSFLSVTVKDTVVRNNSETGLVLDGSASLERVRVEDSDHGINIGPLGRVTIRDSVITGSTDGISASGLLGLEGSVLSNNSSAGLNAEGNSVVLVSKSMVSSNNTGLQTNAPGAVVRVAGSSISGNEFGVRILAGSIISFGNNVLSANGADDAFSATVPLE